MRIVCRHAPDFPWDFKGLRGAEEELPLELLGAAVDEDEQILECDDDGPIAIVERARERYDRPPELKSC